MLVLVVAACGGADAEPTDAEYARAVVIAVDRTDFALARVTRAKSMDELVKRMSEAGVVITAAANELEEHGAPSVFTDENEKLVKSLETLGNDVSLDSGADSAARLRDAPHGGARSELRQLGRSQLGARQSHRVGTPRPDPPAALALRRRIGIRERGFRSREIPEGVRFAAAG